MHGLGLVHRDVKPSNVLLALDGPRLIDFGIARATDGTASLTATGMSVGSPGYMAPEQIIGKGVTGAADVFSLGAVLAYAATGAGPFAGDSSAALLYKVVHGEPELGPMEGALRDLVAHCLAKDPAARPTPAEVAQPARARRGRAGGGGGLAAGAAGGGGQPGGGGDPGPGRGAARLRIRTGRRAAAGGHGAGAVHAGVDGGGATTEGAAGGGTAEGVGPRAR